MKMPVALLLLLALSCGIQTTAAGEPGRSSSDGQCDHKPSLEPRPHSVSILEFGAVADGKTLNTIAFQNAIFYLKSFTDKGGAQLYVPKGKWLTGSFNLTSHLTLFLAKGATILGSQDPSHWDVVEPLPSYGRGIELPGARYRSLINGYKLQDVVITGDEGSIDGQGKVWWDWYNAHSLNYSRPHLVELVQCEDIVVSNLTFLNAPAYSIHPVYCSNVLVQNISISTPPESPGTVGIVPDSSNNICIEDSSIETGHDAIALKSGWDEYGINYGRPTMHVHVRDVTLKSSAGACIALGSEMSGGISDVQGDDIRLHDSRGGIELRTTRGRGGYIERVFFSGVEMTGVEVGLVARGDMGEHPDQGFDRGAVPLVREITFRDVVGSKVGLAGNFTGAEGVELGSICLLNVTLASGDSWVCSGVDGFSEIVSPEPCQELADSEKSSSSCYDVMKQSYGRSFSL
ncbi:unnamed protein product [Linum trigynum]|uniref:Polygalacturonase n=1 Tax=Linum trigynum TaxID=586398 RepID=A0AAV2FG94_9ROSI